MKLWKNIKHDYLELLPPTTFFFIAFSLILVTKRLILSEYGISWTGFGTAVIGALLVGKVVLIVDKLSFVHRYTDRPLIYIASWKCLIYFLAANLLQYSERIIPLLMKHESFMEANRQFMAQTVWPHFWLIQIWLAVLFFAYCSMRELVRAIGKDKVIKMFFSGPSEAD
ncbi:MAG: hypothetical protein HQK60_12755 [Deltaproteobacteria bacterium]|nr:hypothetical protein [Deltaproteobacteria bacterium]